MVEKIEMDSRKQHLQNLERELKIYEEDYTNTQEALGIMQRRIEVTKELNVIKFNNFHPNPDRVLWKFEQDPKYIELTKELHVAESEAEMKKMASAIASGKDKLSKLEANIKSSQEEITRIKAVIGDAE